jgi:two-component system cell cycle sensor histidine kinase/response regulator CckA
MSNLVCLVVDDEEAVRTLLRAVLKKEHLHCLEAESPSEALKIINRLEGRVDLVITDINMPGDMNGVDLAQAIGRLYPHIATVLTTGYAETEAIRRAAKTFKLIRKPFVVETVLGTVKDLIKSA